MKARPILFNGDMVRAILDGRKTQTRRALKDQPVKLPDYNRGNLSIRLRSSVYTGFSPDSFRHRCPFGRRGDLLWVRETFARVPATAYRNSVGVPQTVNPDDQDWAAIYRAEFDRSTGGIAWKPSIHMPRWASRLTLEITDVRVERLQEITEDDAEAEGCNATDECWSDPLNDDNWASGEFRRLWDSIYSNWDANPWVWVVEFKAHQVNVDRFNEVAA